VDGLCSVGDEGVDSSVHAGIRHWAGRVMLQA